jgi:TolB-like protein
MSGSTKHPVYEFSGFRVDPAHRRLLSMDGKPVALTSRVFDTLLFFVEHRGELLDKATLMQAVWPDTVVEENNLNQAISTLRRVLGEKRGEHRYIVTEPGRGYRFVAEIGSASLPSKAPDQPKGTEPNEPNTSNESLAASSTRSSIAVLPFANLTGDPGKEYFSDGMAEELIHTLARVPGLKVPARTSSFAYKGRKIDVRRVARELEVGAVLEGSVRSAGDRIRVTAQLVDGQTGYQLWSQNYDRQFEDLFKLQDDLAGAIVQALGLTLDGRVADLTLRGPPTEDLEAYQLYLQAMGLQAQVPEGIPRAIALLGRAIERAPTFARAYNNMAWLRAVAIGLDMELPGTIADTEGQLMQALALDPQLGAAHAALGMINAAQGKWNTAEKAFRKSLELDDGDPSTHLGYARDLAGSAGFLTKQFESSQRAHELAPAWFAPVLNLAVGHLNFARFDQARQQLQLAVELGLPEHVSLVPDLFAALATAAKRHNDAVEYIVQVLPVDIRAADGDNVVRQAFPAFEKPELRDAAVQGLDELRSRIDTEDTPQLMKKRFMIWYAMLDGLDQAFELVNQLLDHYARTGTIGVAWGLLWTPQMRPFRQDPRFQQLCARMNLFEYWNAYGPPDNCELHDGKLVCH